MDRAYFSRLCYEAAANRITRTGGINTHGEKRLHQVLKRYYEPDETRHEQPVGRHIADIARPGEIVEIQTGSLYPMKAKIAAYLVETDCRITVVHPVIERKWVTWVDPESGEMSKRNRSPKKGSVLGELDELIYFADYLDSGRLTFVFPRLEVSDFRLLDGWSRDRKRGSTRYERIPLDLYGEAVLAERADYAALIPDALAEGEFTAKEFGRAARIASRPSYAAIKVLCAVGVLEAGEKVGRAQTWHRVITSE